MSLEPPDFISLVREMDKAVADLRKLIHTVSTEQVVAEGRLNLINERVEGLLHSVKASGDGLEARTRKIENTLAELNTVKSDLAKNATDMKTLEKRVDELGNSITNLKGQISTIESEEDTLAQDDRDRTARNQLWVAVIGTLISIASMGVAVWAVLHGTH